MELVSQRDAAIPLQCACRALGLPRASVYRRLRPRPLSSATRSVRSSVRALSEDERREVLEVLHADLDIGHGAKRVVVVGNQVDLGLDGGRPGEHALVEDQVERQPKWAPTAQLTVAAGFVVTIVGIGLLTTDMRDVLPWWSIVVSNTLAVIVAGSYLLWKRPGAWDILSPFSG